MSRRRISGSIFWGLLFVAFGALILARNLGYPIPLWPGIMRYWPVVLIVWGLFKLVDYLGMESSDNKSSLFTGGDVAAIVLVVFLGSILTVAANMAPNLGRLFQVGDFDVWDLTGNNFYYDEQHMMDASPDSTIEISNRYGDVDVMPTEDNRITVDVRKTIRAANQDEAGRLSTEFMYSITKEGSSFHISTNFNRRLKTSLTVHVPVRSLVSVENRNGKVSIRGLTGTQSVANRFGDVDVQGITGIVKIENQNGTVNVIDVSDAVSIANTFAPITVANIRGDLKISGRNNTVEVEHAEKNVDVESAFQNIDIRDPRGAVHVTNRNGEISIRFQQRPNQDVSISSEFGNVILELPGDSAFTADVHNRFGSVYSEFTELHTSSERNEHSLSGQVGVAGPAIRIDNRNGEIRFRKRG